MIEFILNNKLVQTDEKSGSTLLDFVRYHQQLMGTKIGCREGDCGACTLLMGSLVDGKMQYKSLTSCITPLGNAQGKHIVSIEGLNMKNLTPYQQAMVDESGQQCGFCTVGFIVSFAGECLSDEAVSYDAVISAIDGNICRCTGYKSIERAAQIVYQKIKNKDLNNPVQWCVDHQFVPQYFETIANRLSEIKSKNPTTLSTHQIIGGGTDLLVQKHDAIYESDLNLFADKTELTGITEEDGYITIKAASNTSQLLHSPIMKAHFPNLWKHIKLVSSTPIRNIATIAGNFINASPIGDLTAFFIALDTDIELSTNEGKSRTLKLKELFLDYKKLDKTAQEHLSLLKFKIPQSGQYFNFEKVSKRRYLDIATVNTALSIVVNDTQIEALHLSAGGVGPIPKYLDQTCAFLKGKKLLPENIVAASEMIAAEISPISDARGTKEYKTLLLKQLFFAHFISLFPQSFSLENLR